MDAFALWDWIYSQKNKLLLLSGERVVDGNHLIFASKIKRKKKKLSTWSPYILQLFWGRQWPCLHAEENVINQDYAFVLLYMMGHTGINSCCGECFTDWSFLRHLIWILNELKMFPKLLMFFYYFILLGFILIILLYCIHSHSVFCVWGIGTHSTQH